MEPRSPVKDCFFQAHEEGGMFEIPCLCSSPITLSSTGALSPSGSGNHGFDKTSPIASSMLSFDCKVKKINYYIKTINHVITLESLII